MSRPTFTCPGDLEQKIKEYFAACDADVKVITDSKGSTKELHKPYTITGLCYFIGISKVSLYVDWLHKPEYKEVFEEARLRVENYCEENTMIGQLNPVFSIFSLKNNFGWVDTQTISVSQEPEKLSAEEIKKRLHKSKNEDEE